MAIGTNNPNDVSDLGVTTPAYAEVSPVQLPIRGEKRLIPSFVDLSSTQDEIDSGIAAGGQSPDSTNQVDYNDFFIQAALNPLVDYVVVRIPHRGLDASGNADTNSAAVYRFLINPTTVQVNRQTVDYQAFTRSGWKFAVWGEDMISISMSGKTAGQYFNRGLTDGFQSFSESYRNLQQLMMVFENNGYWFEGEEAGEGPLVAPDFTRRHIKVHQDVELMVGNFIWYGMFDALTVTQDAENPFNLDFTLSFVAWKERFRSGSPYRNSIQNEVQRGHSYGVFATYGQQQIAEAVQQLPFSPSNFPAPEVLPPDGSTTLVAPAVAASQAEVNLPLAPTSATDYTPMDQVFFPTDSFWNQ